MNFDDFDKKMRVFETGADTCVLPEIYIVARLDGRSFTRLTKDVCKFEAPFDQRFRDLMISTTKSLMQCGFHIRYAYVQSDEISLLFAPGEKLFSRKLRKFNSILAAQASANFSMEIGQLATFDCRVSQLPNLDLVSDYFRWRNQDAFRNALNAHCYWAMRKSGISAGQATRRMIGMSVADKNELLNCEFNVNFNDLPSWQKRGVGLYWETFQKVAQNPLTGKSIEVTRRRIKTNFELPIKDDYSAFVESLVA